MDKQEKIVCAAVKAYVIPHENWYAEPFYHVFKVINHEDYKEEHIYRYLEVFDNPAPVFGFFTSKNRFVDAKEAMRIAVEENQIEAIRKAFDAIPNFHDKGIDSHEFGEAANAAIDIRDDYLSRELKSEDLY